MVIVFWVGWASGDTVATVLFAIVAHSLHCANSSRSRRRGGDHRSLVLAFFVVLPIQFWLVATAAFRPVHRVHPGLRVSGDSGGQRAG
jgi:phosphatidate cytidylyltransferase